ncbi:hypothetical protein Q4Q35_06700 [Flavivirga aquimarina]|uniref:Glycosyl transferase family 1 domain-containing protein n=1 Tax=Flavivirga aquimarina TaxID=2027862 RepID=A0ABT8W8V3_9FLAO|nr:hypothetical protein [Flavivirga aquimarina]MDO5969489.1 hypothetical protein [Flavivirga aquimarina]
MKIILYDPLYAEKGHYQRYSKYISKLLCSSNKIEKVYYFTDKSELNWDLNSDKIQIIHNNSSRIEDIQTKFIQVKNEKFKKLKLIISSFLHYYIVLKQLKRIKADKTIFLSQGQLSFWIPVLLFYKNYVVSVIILKWLYETKGVRYFVKKIFELFLKKSNITFFTEDIYQEDTKYLNLSKTFVLSDRFLHTSNSKDTLTKSKNSQEKIKLLTLGTISSNKNPINFLKQFKELEKNIQSRFEYKIYGKIVEENLNELWSLANEIDSVILKDEYINQELYVELMSEADLIVIPYSGTYLRYATSGVMWDCFEKSKLILCPEHELFMHYINHYQIGYTYNQKNFNKVLKGITNNTPKKMINNFEKLQNDFAFDRQVSILEGNL